MSGEWVRGLNVGDYINVEFEGAWYRATIANKTETQVRIEYVKLINGKVKREFIRMTSERLAQDGSKNAGGGAAAGAATRSSHPRRGRCGRRRGCGGRSRGCSGRSRGCGGRSRGRGGRGGQHSSPVCSPGAGAGLWKDSLCQ